MGNVGNDLYETIPLPRNIFSLAKWLPSNAQAEPPFTFLQQSNIVRNAIGAVSQSRTVTICFKMIDNFYQLW